MSVFRPQRFNSALAALLAAAALMAAAVRPAQAQGTLSDASVVSLLPVAVSVAAPVVLVAGASALTVVAVEAAAEGSTWVLERASDGARSMLRFGGHASVAAGTAIVVSTVATGWVLCAAGRAIALVPNEAGRALLHNERISR